MRLTLGISYFHVAAPPISRPLAKYGGEHLLGGVVYCRSGSIVGTNRVAQTFRGVPGGLTIKVIYNRYNCCQQVGPLNARGQTYHKTGGGTRVNFSVLNMLEVVRC